MARITVNPPTTETPPTNIQPSYERTAAAENYNWRVMLANALIITRREVVDSFRDWRILAPILVLTLVFPMIANLLASRWFGFVERYAGDNVEILGGRSIPFLLMIVGFFPISISLVIALETFVGEKERRSLEPLLSTPLTNTELYIGKTLSSMIPPLVASYGGMIFYLLVLVFGELSWRPQPALVVQIFLLTTVQALVMITGAVVVSSQATSTRSANLLASFVIIPMTIVIQAESFVMFIAPDADSPWGISSLWLTAFGMMVVVLLLLRVGNAIFNREELLGRTIDELNIRGTLQRMWRNIRTTDPETLIPAKNLFEWYSKGMSGAMRRQGAALWLTVIWFGVAVLGGLYAGTQEQWQLPLPNDLSAIENSTSLNFFLDSSLQQKALTFIFFNNVRILGLALIAGALTFGIGAYILTPAVFVVLGYLFVQLQQTNLNMNIFYSGILVHGIVEIPVIILATAAAFKLGAVITKPPIGKTVGMAWMSAFGDAMKIYVGLVLPGLLIAAAIEAFITPRVVLIFMGA